MGSFQAIHSENSRFPQGFPHLWKSCAKPTEFLLIRVPEGREIPLRRKEKENGKTEFSLLWKTNRFSPFSTKKPLFHKENAVEKTDERKKASPFSKTAPPFPIVWGGERVFQKVSPTFSTAFPKGNQQAERRGSLVRQGEIEFSPVSTDPTSTTAILLYIPSFLFRFAESERARKGPKSFSAFFGERRVRKRKPLGQRAERTPYF